MVSRGGSGQGLELLECFGSISHHFPLVRPSSRRNMDPAIEDSVKRSVLGKTKLDGDEINIMVEMFKYYDTDNDAHLTRDEASTLYLELGYVAGGHWSQKRVPLETFLLKCGAAKKDMLDNAVDDLEARCRHAFRILDNPRTDSVNQHKLRNFLKEIDLKLEDATIERIAELISSSDEPDFTEEDMIEYVKTNLRMAHGMLNAQEEEEEKGES